MSILLQRIEWYPGGSNTGTILVDVNRVSVRLTGEAKNNSAEIVLNNPLSRNITSTTGLHRYVNSDRSLMFGEGDIIKIYVTYTDTIRDISTVADSADLLMTAEVSEIGGIDDGSKTSLTLKCVDKTYSVLNKLWSFNYGSTLNLTAPQIIQEIIRNVSDDSSGGDVQGYDSSGNLVRGGPFGIDARLTTGDYPGDPGSPKAFIQAIRPDDSVFPIVSVGFSNKPAYEWITELSTIEYTNTDVEITSESPISDRNYVFYVDEQNRFHWFYPADGYTATLSSAINDSDTTLPVTSSVVFPSRGRVQIGAELIDYDGTTESGGFTVSFTGCVRAANNTTASSHSSGVLVSSQIRIIRGDISTGNIMLNCKMTYATFDVINIVIFNAGQDLYGNGILNYYYDKNTNSKELKSTYKPWLDISKNLINIEIRSGRLVQDNTQNDFTYEGNFYKADSYPCTTSWGETVSSNTEYNNALRDFAAFDNNSIGKGRAARLTAKRGSPRWKGNIELKGKRFYPQDLISFTNHALGINNQDLRIQSVTHQIQKTGWFVTIDVEEDERKQGDVV